MINRTFLMQMFNNDEAVVNKFIQNFVTEAPGIVDDIEAAINRGDLVSADISSHKLKSHCKYLGLESLAQIARHIESLAQNEGSKDELTVSTGHLRAQLAEVMESIR